MEKILFFLIPLLVLFFIGISYMLYKKNKYSDLIQNFEYNKNKLKMFTSQNRINKINVPIYYINLDRSPQRKKFMEDQFRKYNINFSVEKKICK